MNRIEGNHIFGNAAQGIYVYTDAWRGHGIYDDDGYIRPRRVWRAVELVANVTLLPLLLLILLPMCLLSVAMDALGCLLAVLLRMLDGQ